MKLIKKNFIIIGAAILLVILILAIFLIYQKHHQAKTSSFNTAAGFNVKSGKIIKPDFLTAAEKKTLGVAPNLQIQALKRNASGQVMLYKVVTASSGLVTDLSQINVNASATSSSQP